MSDFEDWLSKEMDRRAWSKAELARRADLSESAVSMVTTGRREPTFDFCVGVAQALGERPEEIMRRAGLIDPMPPEVANEQECLRLYRQLGAQMQAVVIRLLHSFVEEPIEGESETVSHQPRSFKERQAYKLAQELEGLSPEDRDLVYTFMKRLRGDETAEDHPSVPVDTN
jgi:transcriptional regulator with XRE-family HTH domain